MRNPIMKNRATIADVAKQAGLSVATVDRAINGRHAVRNETLRKIHDASKAVGHYSAHLLELQLKRDLPQYKLAFVLLRETHASFFQALARQLETSLLSEPLCRGTSKVEFLDWRSPNEAAAAVRQFGTYCQAIAVVSVDHPAIAAAVAELKSNSVRVFSFLTDVAQGVRDSYVGVNNRKVGRTAAWLIAKTAHRPGQVAILVGSSRFHGHEMREIGFRAYFRERAPDFEVIETLVNPGSERLGYEATKELLTRHPELVGIYVAGLGPEGVIAALRESGLAPRLSIVCHENTIEIAAALADDIITAVIHTPLEQLCRELISSMIVSLREGEARAPGQNFIHSR
jgi:LacI family transcriptional regulator